jgi:hypothetical protein
MTLSAEEIENLRFHLGYGNISVGGYPYTPDGFIEIFRDVISPFLTGAAETSATTQVDAGSVAAITPASMAGIVQWARVVVDGGDDAEIVVVKAVTQTTFTARFAKAHAMGGYPIALLGGKARLRLLLHDADKAWQAMTSQDVGDTAGVRQVDKGDVVMFDGNSVMRGRLRHYLSIVDQIARLVRIRPTGSDGGSVSVEAY